MHTSELKPDICGICSSAACQAPLLISPTNWHLIHTQLVLHQDDEDFDGDRDDDDGPDFDDDDGDDGEDFDGDAGENGD